MQITILNLQKKILINQVKAKTLIRKTLASERVAKRGEITVRFVDDKHIQALNLLYLGELCPTDVISFQTENSQVRLVADIAVSTDTAVRQARVFKTSALYETYLYVVHGVLHALGYDDNTDRKRGIMQKKAEIILATAGISL
ncbi:MAG TPA: rRNA maturation RNase YbeY [Candidatus Omnitrophota bacterium]|nr:rRNA maturation RNase YbeY [Candidatus Omnitrophota bacterium]